MIDESIKTILSLKESDLDFKKLLSFMEDSNITFYDRKLKGPWGIATYYAIFLDIARLDLFADKMLYYVILHEMSHFKSISRVGKEGIIKILSNDNFDEFFEHIIIEETTADRYACALFYKFNKQIFPIEGTQQLNIKSNKEKYRGPAKLLFGTVNNSDENYRKLLESFIA